MKLKVQAQSLQPGDIVGSGEVVRQVRTYSRSMQKGKCEVMLEDVKGPWVVKPENPIMRCATCGKYTMINVERPGKPMQAIEDDRPDGVG